MTREITPENSVITLDLDNGSQLICDVLAIFPAGDYEYIALLPHSENSDSDILVYRFVEDENGNPILSKVGTDEEFEIVAETFNELQDEAIYEELGFGDSEK